MTVAVDLPPWRNAVCAQVGKMVARRRSSAQIAARLGYGMTPEEVELRVASWGGTFPDPLPEGHELVTLSFSGKHRTQMGLEAIRRGMDMDELIGAVLAAIAEEGLHAAILDR